jgi:serine/threonine protein kinase/tetratricopeptide (TPR) repeat protein
MSDPEWARAKEIFGLALELPREQHASFIEAACAGEPGLRARVQGLLAADEGAGDFLSAPSLIGLDSPGAAVDTESAAGVGRRIGPYTLLNKIGEGGFGTVFEAEQSEPLRRRVALKVIKLGMDTRQVIAQFEHERQALALMDHPNIARVFDAGATSEGRPYFVMEFITGMPITQYCDRERLSPRQRLELFVPVCHAVQHAHQKGIIHRDLKPSNVLVTLQDGIATPKVIDFGIAKATARHLSEKTAFTQSGQFIGTPEYMSPEQAVAGLDIDTRSDVYSLGVLLYELLTGATPFDAKELRSAAWTEVQRIIREVDPPKPSTRLSKLEALPRVASERHTEPSRLGSALRGDLDWIVMKCLEKDRTRRYATANGLAADVQRHLKGEAVLAAPAGAWYRTRKLVRRHKLSVLMSGLLISALLLGTVGTGVGLVRARAAKRAESRVIELMGDLLKGVSPYFALGRDTTMLKGLLDDAAASLEAGGLHDAPEAEVRLRRTVGKTYLDISEFKPADRMLIRAFELAKITWKGDHEIVAGSQNDLGLVHANTGRLAEAEADFAAALAMQRRLFSGDHRAIAESLNNLAYCIQALGRPTEALPLYRESLAMRQRLFTGDHTDIAESLNNVGYCLADGIGDADGALPMYRAALEMRQRLFKTDHPDIALSLSNVGAALQMLHQSNEALPKFQASMSMFQRLIPKDHVYTAQAMGNVAFSLQQLGRKEEALPLYTASLDMYRRLLPGDFELVAGAINNVGYCLASMERLPEALAAHGEALAMRQRIKQPGPLTRSLNNFGTVLVQMGKPAEAEPILRECLDLSTRLWPDGDRKAQYRYVTMSVLGEALAMQGSYTAGESMLTEACDRLATIPKPTLDDPDGERKAMQRLEKLYQAWDKADPGRGHDAKASACKAKLDALNSAAPK